MSGHVADGRKHLHFDISQTSMVSVEGLAKLVDPSQLTDDFDGSLDYNHEEWMELRVSLEEFMSNAVHLLSRLEDLQVSRCVGVWLRNRLAGGLTGSKNEATIAPRLSGASVQEGLSCRCGRIPSTDRGTYAAEKKGWRSCRGS